MKTLILDNYDSFTFNLYQYVAELEGNPVVYRNDEFKEVSSFVQPTSASLTSTGRQAQDDRITHIILSPGPGNPDTPRDVGMSNALIDYAVENKIPLLGVCLGHQTLGHRFGAEVVRAPEVFHGKASAVTLAEPRSALFTDVSDQFEAMRYHSLCIDPDTLSPDFRVTATSEPNLIMAIEHESLPLYGIQFHLESIGTPDGKNILKNFLAL